MKHIAYQSLKSFTEKVFLEMGCPTEEAKEASEVLLSADLRGVDSHGVARLNGYIRLWEQGRINAKPNIKIVHETPSTAVVDGDKGLGLVVAPFAMRLAMEKARNVGTGWVSVKNSNHYGIAGYHSMMALENDMIGWSMTNASPLVSPTFSTERLLGTNPISIAIPAAKQPPFVADFATTTAANGKLEVLKRKNEKAPFGWVQDANGKPTTDVDALKSGGSMLPLGGDREHASHKGYILGSIVDIFSAVLSGANYGPWAPPFVSFLPLREDPVGEGLGHFLGAMRIDAFRPANDFKAHMDNWIETFRKSAVTEENDRVIIPGDPEREISEQRIAKGIPLMDSVIEDLSQIGNRFEIDFGKYFKE
ncbi:Ldh family oxidoreductase [Marivirga sp. S37H4]|uniref:Ldh family oxidoreductase n=1 Tax=Marivirga aurantiaca TaxID=2802615 RepID=A0A934X2N6_9BACT|nr:Ldh family oxidoreductase [Marivirga aurantiaca]MBK6267245.1 Ldh family oxidoreductase [Marivirga aurantiaca]